MSVAELTPTITLSPDQIEFYHREGYLALDALTTPEEVEWLKEVYDRLFQSRAGREVGDQFDLAGSDEEGKPATLPQILGPSRYAPELKEGLFRVNALAVARQLLGPECQAMGEHAIFKPAEIGAPTPLHQDEAYWDPGTDYNSMSIWIPLQPATVENGCMQFVPRSHEAGVVPHHPIDHDPRVHGLEVDDEFRAPTVACPIPAGGATIHHCRTLHYAGPNRTDQPRRAYILGFGLPPTKRSEVRDFYWNAQKQTARQQRAEAAQGKSGNMGM